MDQPQTQQAPDAEAEAEVGESPTTVTPEQDAVNTPAPEAQEAPKKSKPRKTKASKAAPVVPDDEAPTDEDGDERGVIRTLGNRKFYVKG